MPELLIRAGQVFTATDRDPLLKDAWVRVEGDRIVEVTSAEPRAASDATRIDAADATLLPRLAGAAKADLAVTRVADLPPLRELLLTDEPVVTDRAGSPRATS